MAKRVKNLPATQRSRFDPQIRKITWGRKWLLTSVFLPGEFHGQRSLVGCSPWGHKESDMSERVSTQHRALKHPHDCQMNERHRQLGCCRIQHTPEGTASLDSVSELIEHLVTISPGWTRLPRRCRAFVSSADLNCSASADPAAIWWGAARYLCLSSLCVVCCFRFLSSLLIFSVQLFPNVLFLISFSCSPPCQGKFISFCSFKQQLQVNDVQMFILGSNHFKKLTATFHCYQHVRLHIWLRICLNFCSSTMEHISLP